MRLSIGVVLVMTVVLSFNCINESDETIRRKLHIILDDDLESVIEDIPAENLRDSVYYVVREFETFDQGTYRVKAVVDFYFLRSVDVIVVRKYRYHRQMKLWDRYFNEFLFLRK